MKFIFILITLLVSGHGHSKDKVATFAGGCFWCMEPPYEKLVGVKEVISGYAGGTKKNPAYKEVATGKTKHREAVQVIYDPSLVSYERLLEIFWMNVNPTDNEGQFVDRGFQYSPAIFFHDEKEKTLAVKSADLLNKSKVFKKEIITPIIKFTTFYPAEDYHQNYYKKNALTKVKYKYYRNASGRDDFINKYWKEGDQVFKAYHLAIPDKKNLKKKLSEIEYQVTQEDATEPPFKNKYWNNKQEGIYIDIVSKEPLFSSKDKFKSGTGWPSFTKPIDPNHIIEFTDNKLFSERVEVRSRFADSHLGHVFRDGPKPTGLRYCINSASLEFVSKKDLEKRGLERFSYLFK